MQDAYAAKIARSKAPKKPMVVSTILHHLLTGVRKGQESQALCDSLNECRIKPLIADKWTPNSVAMQLMFIARLDETNSLARGFMQMIRKGEATMDDLALIQARTRH